MPRPNFQTATDKIAEILRVDHAGEYGAKRIYQGQLRFAKRGKDTSLISEMLKHEEEHLEYFNKELTTRHLRPTALIPIWHIAGYALGNISSLLGLKYSMLVTQAVEEVIEQHYQEQIDYLKTLTPPPQELLNTLNNFQAEEIRHKGIAAESNKNQHILFASLIELTIKKACRIAIALSKKI